MGRTTAKGITIDQNVRSRRVWPVEDTENTSCPAKHSEKWRGDTVGFRLTKEEAIHLARVLLAVTQEWEEIDVVAWRHKRNNDGSYPVTVTSLVDSPQN